MNKRYWKPILYILIVCAGIYLAWYYTTASSVILSMTPTSAPAPQTNDEEKIISTPVHVTIRGKRFDPKHNTILFNGHVGEYEAPTQDIPSSENGTVITFQLPATLGPDCPNKPGQLCTDIRMSLEAATYSIIVENTHGKSNPITFVVTQ